MYIDLLIKLKNAQAVKGENVKVSYSKMDEAVLEVLVRGGYVDDFDKKGRGPKKIMDIKLKYEDKRGRINGVKFVSRPSRRIYAGWRDIKRVRHGHGLLLISTPKGIMSGYEARKKRLGGEILFEIW